MFKKSLLIMLLMAFMAPWAAMGQAEYNLVASAPEGGDWSGNYVIAYSTKAATATISSYYFTSSDITVENNKITSLGTAAVFEIGKIENTDYYYIKNNDNYLKLSDGDIAWDNATNYNGGSADAFRWTISFTSSSNIVIKNATKTSQALRYYSYYSCFYVMGTSSGNSISLYKQTINNNPYVTITPATATIVEGGTVDLTADPQNITTGTPVVSWSMVPASGVVTITPKPNTDNKEVIVTGVAEGDVTITATVSVDNVEVCHEDCTVTVSNELTVNDGTTTNSYIPFEGFNADSKHVGQMLYPASSLTTIDGKIIKKMVFYYNTTGAGSLATSWKVKLGTTTATTLDALDETTVLTEVYSGSLTFNTTDKTMTIEFDNDYLYTGDNLLVQFNNENTGYRSYTFLGVETTNYASFNSYENSAYKFLPKTTFKYEDATGCTKPTNLQVPNDYLTYSSAKLTWGGLASAFDVAISIDNYDEPAEGEIVETAQTEKEYTFSSLTQNTTYYAFVRGNCGSGSTSDWEVKSFTTAVCPAPTGISATIAANNSARVVWVAPHNDVTSYTYKYKAEGGSWSAEASTTNLYADLPVLSYSTTYTFSVKAIYPGINNSSVFAEASFDTPSQYPAPTDLTTTNIKTSGASLAWNEATGATGYNLRYKSSMGNATRVSGDDDFVAEFGYNNAYTASLDDFAGQTGRIAIRHYNCTAQYYLAVDDVEIKDGNDDIILTESFEGNAMPEGWTAIDKDGDGYNWAQYGSSSYGHTGTGVVYSESYHSGTDLTPDNWLLTPVVELGGSISFWARGVWDGSSAEHFAVYVLTDNWTVVNGLTEENYNITSGLEGLTEYQVQVQAVYDANNSAWSDAYSFTTLPVKNYTSTSQYYNWSSSYAWSPSGVPTANHDVLISGTATIPNGTIAQANNITIANSGSLTLADGGQLICNNNPEVTVEKTILKHSDATGVGNTDGWYFIASPVNKSNFAPGDVEHMLENIYDLYRLEPSTMTWENYKAHNTTTDESPFLTLDNGKGYLYANDEDVDLSFTGEIKPYTTESNAHKMTVASGYNLIGNPYTFAAFIDRPYYSLDEEGDRTIILPVEIKNVAINPCTGVIVDGGNDGVTVGFYKESQSIQAVNNGDIQMTLAQTVTNRGGSNVKTLDKAIVSFNEGSELGKFYFMEGNANLYIPQGAEEYAIVSSNGQGTMPVNFRANENGQYTLTVNPEGVEMNYLHIIDNMTGADIDLLATPSYTFNAKVTDYESRFKLVFVSATDNAEGSNDSFAFFSNGQLIIANEGQATLQVIDITGRILSSESINGSVSKSLNAPAGIYMLRLVNGDNVKVQKMVVR